MSDYEMLMIVIAIFGLVIAVYQSKKNRPQMML